MKRCFVLLLLVAASPPARAEEMMVLGQRATGKKYSSPQHFALEIKFGPYSPDIDSTPGLKGKPFSELFQDQWTNNAGKRPGGRLLTSVELDWQIWHGFGSLGLAASAGIMRRTTHSFIYPMTTSAPVQRGGDTVVYPNIGVPCITGSTDSNTVCVRSGDQTALSVIPLTLELVYRFDVLATKWRVPIVPYLKGGLGYYFWWIENGSGGLSTSLTVTSPGTATTNSGDHAIGGTFGLVFHPGIAILLDAFDPSAAQTMDAELGINHTYLFAELNYAWITGFGIGNKMVLSDLTWNAGVAFEF